MAKTSSYPQNLEPRFRAPQGWCWRDFRNPKGRALRSGSVMPEKPDAVVVGLQGLSEFTEKYFETARTLLDHNLGFCMMDWQGHGKSDRPLKNPHKRHSNSFDNDVDDLHFFLTDHVKPETGTLPLVMLGHSTGGNIGLRHLEKYPSMFACAAFTAPLVGINAIRNLPGWLRRGLTRGLKEFLNHNYVFGGGDWHPEIRGERGRALLSSDPARNRVQDEWCLHDPALRVGGVTFGWLAAAEASCARLQKRKTLAALEIPCLFALAGEEHLVDNGAIRKLAGQMKNTRVIEFPGSRHEILMERDGIRDTFFDAFFTFLNENNIRKR